MNIYDENAGSGFMIRDLADDDKPREKALTHGVSTLTATELLAIMLRTGLKGRSVMEVSRQIMSMCDNNLARLARMTPAELSRLVPGIGPTKAVTLMAAIELGVRCHGALTQTAALPQLLSSETVHSIMLPLLERLNYEEFWVLMLNRANRIESKQRLSQGGMASTVVDTKLLFKRALDAQASGIILVHNHPSGNARPSGQDDALTRRVADGGKLLDINVLDHLIITPSGYYSYHDDHNIL